MMDGLKPYPEYKDSGVPWLGKTPARWAVRRGKWLFRNQKELNRNRANKNVLSLTLRGVVNNDPDDPEGLVPKDYATYQLFKKGDLVFKLIDLENLRTSRVGLVHEDGIMSSAYVRLIPQTACDIRFFFHQYFDLYSRGVYNQIGAGVRSTLGAADLLNVPVLLPDSDEQAAIVRFLDHANGRIERAIRAKKKLMALLNEQKQAIIHRAVTRGLNPNAPLKPSGIPWLGDIPKHWEIAKIGQKTQILRGKFSHRPRNAPQFYGGRYPFIQTGDISAAGKYIQSHTQTLNERGLAISKLFLAGTLAMIITGAKTGHVAILGFDACFPDSSVGFYPFINQTDKEFLYYLFIALKTELDRASITSTQENLSVQRIRSQVAAWPPISEQTKIAHHLNRDLQIQNKVIERAEREIVLLREYRTRLVADVVTGKLDVRAAAAKLPAEIEAPAENVASDELAEETETEEAEA